MPEKNLDFLVQAVTAFLSTNGAARFLVVGTGPSAGEIRERFERCGMADRLHYAGVLRGEELADAYHAMDVFAFASRNETQGMVLMEAMAAGVPVVAVDAPGVREAVVDGWNGFLLPSMSVAGFLRRPLAGRACRPPAISARWGTRRGRPRSGTRSSGAPGRRCSCTAPSWRTGGASRDADGKPWGPARRLFGQERMLWRNRAHAAAVAFSHAGARGRRARTGGPRKRVTQETETMKEEIRMNRPANGAVELLREQLRAAWETLEGTTKDLSPETAHWIPPGTALPIGAAYAHAVFALDGVVNGMVRGSAPAVRRGFRGEDRDLRAAPGVLRRGHHRSRRIGDACSRTGAGG